MRFRPPSARARRQIYVVSHDGPVYRARAARPVSRPRATLRAWRWPGGARAGRPAVALALRRGRARRGDRHAARAPARRRPRADADRQLRGARSTSTDAPGVRKLLFVVERAGTIAVARDGTQAAQAVPRHPRPGPTRRRGGPALGRLRPRLRSEPALLRLLHDRDRDIEVDEFKRDAARRPAPRRLAAHGDRDPPPRRREPPRRPARVRRPTASSTSAPATAAAAATRTRTPRTATSLLGKLLRIDPHGASGGYSIPSSNPFAAGPARDEIYALGLRNPFRFSFDRRRGEIAIGDVGQSDWEEVDLVTARRRRGANFGWDHFEGNHCLRGTAAPTPRQHYEPPVHEYSHGAATRDHRRLRRPRPRPAGARRPLRLRRLLRRRAALASIPTRRPERDATPPAGAADRPAQPRSARAPAGGIYVASLADGAVYRIVAGD